jgi:excisionase family DNA binding protein
MDQTESILAILEDIKDLLHGKTKKLMSIKDVADYTGYAPITIRRAILAGKLKARRTGRKYLLTMHDMERWLNG